jgi:hypothetical protein
MRSLRERAHRRARILGRFAPPLAPGARVPYVRETWL